jgi:transposase
VTLLAAEQQAQGNTIEALATQVGADGYHLLDGVSTTEPLPHLRDLAAVDALRQIWLQHYDRCTVPGYATLRGRTGEEHAPAAVRITSPYALEARDRTKRTTEWVGSTLHLTETCDPDHPDLITQVLTTPATTPDAVMGPTIEADVAARDLLPGTHLLDSGYVDADVRVTAQTQHQVDVVGPPLGSYEAQQARCPQGHTSVKWTPGHDVSGAPVIRIRFDRAPCRTCPARRACTSAKAAPRQLTVRPQALHAALQAARQRQGTAEFQERYARRSGVESSLSQGVRRFALRRSRYLGLARTHLQHVCTATAMNVVRVIAWLHEEPLGEHWRKPGHFARLAPEPLSRRAVLC